MSFLERPGIYPQVVLLLISPACSIDLAGVGATSPSARDAGPPDARRPDAPLERDAGDVRPDAGPVGPDAGDLGSCVAPDPDTLALYPFDPDEGTAMVTDFASTHDGRFETLPAWTSGPDGCGRAPSFAIGGSPHAVIPDAPQWDLAVGSLDLWVRWDGALPLTNPVAAPTILSRDASAELDPHHFVLLLSPSGRLFARIQRDGPDLHLCSDASLVTGRWTHVGVNFGPPAAEMWVDGVLATSTDPVTVAIAGTQPWPCNERAALGIDGNDEPWTVGVSSHTSAAGTAAPIGRPFSNGAVDHLRISSVRRDFATDR